jgi:hypothetical protein
VKRAQKEQKYQESAMCPPPYPPDQIGQVCVAAPPPENPPENRAATVAKLEALYASLNEYGLDWAVTQQMRGEIARRICDLRLR